MVTSIRAAGLARGGGDCFERHMSGVNRKPPGGAQGDRAAREAAALRENLRKRKAQARLREAEARAAEDSAALTDAAKPGDLG